MPTNYFRNRPTNQKQPRADTVHDSVQIKNVAGIIQDAQIYERARERYTFAVNALGVSCNLYRKLVQGQMCSCMRNEIPEANCPCCFGVGYAGGYSQYGHEKYVLSAVSDDLLLHNVEMYDDENDEHLRPTPVVLQGETTGRMEVAGPIYLNGATAWDGYRLYGSTPPRFGGLLQAQFLPPGGDWVSLDTMGTYLESLGAAPWHTNFRLRVVFGNNSPDGRVPCSFHALHLKWQTGNDLVKIEQSSSTEVQNKLTDLGFVNLTSGLKFTMPDRPRVTTRDFFEKRDDGSRLKVTEAKVVDPSDVVLSQDLTLRLVQDTEILHKVF